MPEITEIVIPLRLTLDIQTNERPAVLNYCRTCHHFTNVSAGLHTGDCLKLTGVVSTLVAGTNKILRPPAEFGCIHHQKRHSP